MGHLIRANRDFFSLPSLMDEFFGGELFNFNNGTYSGATLPAVNIRETDDAFELEVAAPGMKKKDFKVELNNDMLIISSEKKDEHSEKNAKGEYTRREFSYCSFRRSFSIPEQMVDGNKISAKYDDGVLKIKLPKREEAKVQPPRLIAIK